MSNVIFSDFNFFKTLQERVSLCRSSVTIGRLFSQAAQSYRSLIPRKRDQLLTMKYSISSHPGHDGNWTH